MTNIPDAHNDDLAWSKKLASSLIYDKNLNFPKIFHVQNDAILTKIVTYLFSLSLVELTECIY